MRELKMICKPTEARAAAGCASSSSLRHPLQQQTQVPLSPKWRVQGYLGYRGTLLIRNRALPGPYSRTIWGPMVPLRRSLFLMSEVPLQEHSGSRVG